MLKVMNRCHKRDAEEELHIFDEVCRTVDAGGSDVAFCHYWKFDVQTEAYGYAKFAYRFTLHRCSNHGQSICVAGRRCAVLPRFSEYWRRWHNSDLRQRRTARATTFLSSGVRLRYFISIYGFVQLTNHSFPVLYAIMTQKTTALYQGVFEKLHALILQ